VTDRSSIDVALARRLVDRQFPQWSALPIAEVEADGWDNRTFRLGSELTVRLPSGAWYAKQVETEQRWLPVLAPQLPLPIPTPVAKGAPDAGFPYPWSIYRWLDGELASRARIDDPSAFATTLAGFLNALRRADPTDGPPPGEHNFFRGVPLATRDAGTRVSLAALGVPETAWEAALAAPEWDGPPVWIHGDLDARNLLVHDGRLSGVIDWGGLGVGDPACDVMVAWKVLSAERREEFRAALTVDDATWARARGWAVSTAVNALTYYTEETNAALVHEARRWLAEALDDDAS
jgi:aminoglycoside phosphotransferase (APT) family kinase protein